MSLVEVQLKNARGATIGGLTIDVTVSEDHRFASEVTEFPVEDGGVISDNIVNKPVELSIEGLVSDSPLISSWSVDETGDASDIAGKLPDARNYSKSALEALEKIRTDKELISIDTPLRLYENMALVDLSVPRSATTGKALSFRANFKQISMVASVLVDLPPDQLAPSSGTPGEDGAKDLGSGNADKGYVYPDWKFDVELPGFGSWMNSIIKGLAGG